MKARQSALATEILQDEEKSRNLLRSIMLSKSSKIPVKVTINNKKITFIELK